MAVAVRTPQTRGCERDVARVGMRSHPPLVVGGETCLMLVVGFLLVMAVLYVRAQTLDLGYRVNDLELQIAHAKDDVNALRAQAEKVVVAIAVEAQAEESGRRQATRADFDDLTK